MEKPVNDHKPFFLYMSHYAAHVPFAADKRFVQKYLDVGLPEKEAQYASMIEGMNKSLGDIVNYLKEKNIDKKAIGNIYERQWGGSQAPRGGKIHTQNLPLN